MPPVPHEICLLMRDLRIAAGLTLRAFEHKHGIKAVVAGSYERGDRKCTLETADRVLACYGMKLAAVPIHPGPDGHHTYTPEEIAAVLRAIAEQIRSAAGVPTEEGA